MIRPEEAEHISRVSHTIKWLCPDAARGVHDRSLREGEEQGMFYLREGQTTVCGLTKNAVTN